MDALSCFGRLFIKTKLVWFKHFDIEAQAIQNKNLLSSKIF